MEAITIIYLALMFISLYMFSFFIILTFKNRDKLFSYPKMDKEYFISILIPVYNEEESIGETIKHVMKLEYPLDKFEVIVINDGSKDNTKNIVENLLEIYPNLKLLNKENSGKADSLNKGIEIANGELIAVVDSDSFPSNKSLKKLGGFFNNPKMGAVTSFVTVRNKDSNIFAKIQSLEYVLLGWSRKLLDFVDSVYVTNGPLSLYRKSFVLEVGGFDPKSITEDIDITWNMLNHGYKTGMCLDASVTTIVPNKFKLWFRQRTRWGLGGLQAISKYRSMFFRKGMFGAFVLPYVSFSIILSMFAFLFSSYLILRMILVKSLTTGYSIASNSSLLYLQDINLYPSVLIFYFLVLFSCSILYYSYILRKTDYYGRMNVKIFFNLLFYLLLYLTFYPLIWFVSIYRFIKKDHDW